MARRTINVSDETWFAARMRALSEGRTVSEVVEAALQRPAPTEDDTHRELAARFWVHYRCGMVGCETVEPHEHGGGQPMREMTPEERWREGLHDLAPGADPEDLGFDR